MIKEVLHVSSRCGWGKSSRTVEQLHEHLVKNISSNIILFASKTNALTQQNYDLFCGLIKQSNSNVSVTRVDHSTQGSVSESINDLLKSDYSGVVFISHAALTLIKPVLYKGVELFIDEVPQDLVKCISVRYEAQDGGNKWENYVTTEECKHQGYQKVSLNPLIDVKDVERFVANVLLGKDTNTSKDVAHLLQFLLDDYEVLYSTSTTSDERIFKLYQTTHWLKLKHIIENVDKLVILSAQLKRTMLGFILEKFLKITIEEVNITNVIVSEHKHKNKVKLIPFLKHGTWSSTLKKSVASQSILVDGSPINYDGTVAEAMQLFIKEQFEHKDFVLSANNKEELLPELEGINFHRTSSAVHGLNHLRHIDHGAYMASTRPDPFELKALKLFASDHNLCPKGLEDAVLTERCYESAYQCIARTSIRMPNNSTSKEHLFIIPDMGYARYLESWFEEGNVTIDTTKSVVTVQADTKKQDYYRRRDIAVAILTDKKNKLDKVSNLLKKYNISNQTYCKYKNEHKEYLKKLNLLR